MRSKYTVSNSAINTRRQAESIAGEANNQGADVIDLSKVEFISRSSADELLVLTEKKGIELEGLTGDVAGMMDVIRSHRSGLTA